MILNKKGFTLIELLATIIILSIIFTITISVVNVAVNKAKKKSQELTIQNIEKQAINYISEEMNQSIWTENSANTNSEYQCITIQNLIDAGYLKQSDIEKNKDIISSKMYIEVIRNKKTKVIISQTLVNSNSQEYLCTYVPVASK